jgi:hypothetical protein
VHLGGDLIQSPQARGAKSTIWNDKQTQKLMMCIPWQVRRCAPGEGLESIPAQQPVSATSDWTWWVHQAQSRHQLYLPVHWLGAWSVLLQEHQRGDQ